MVPTSPNFSVSLVHMPTSRSGKKQNALRPCGPATSGAGAVLLSGLLVGLALIFTDKAFQWAAFAVVAAHIPVMVIEGLITVFVIEFLRKMRPEMLRTPGPGTK